jgi:hypothetical protein
VGIDEGGKGNYTEDCLRENCRQAENTADWPYPVTTSWKRLPARRVGNGLEPVPDDRCGVAAVPVFLCATSHPASGYENDRRRSEGLSGSSPPWDGRYPVETPSATGMGSI